ncbi:PAS domain-containing protein [Massilia sp. Dwa41.01b]|uniref:PAS domain-containing protein n=1 Tax=Massilia sp. Dwa41.01b TaxID=2709302 RepID=UPI0016032830|nr:PAS domain-containing protein [Massilia sp. Dwa41.01b]QNA89965.1 PAS domain-containing protein [Massilia sp. Dwa41.01b]
MVAYHTCARLTMISAPLFSRADAFRQRLADHDWAASVLGPVDTWPLAIRTVVRLMLDAKHPMFVFWGPRLGLLYNEAYTDFLQDKHPAAIGQPFSRVWPEIWPALSPLIARALAGESIYVEDMPFVMFRNGRDEQTWFTFSYSPIYDDGGRIVGLYGTGVDTTARVTTERRLAFQVRLGDELRDLADPYAICARTAAPCCAPSSLPAASCSAKSRPTANTGSCTRMRSMAPCPG